MRKKFFPIILFFLIVSVFVSLYYFNAKSKYLNCNYIRIISEKKQSIGAKCYRRNGYEIYYNPNNNESRLIQYSDKYYEMIDSSDYNTEEYDKMWIKITELETFIVLDIAYKTGINDLPNLNTLLIKHRPFDKNCYWVDIIMNSKSTVVHKQIKGKSSGSIGYLNYILAIYYYLRKFIIFFIVIIIFIILFRMQKGKKQNLISYMGRRCV